MITLKELTNKEDLFVSGHGLCPGCGIPIILKLVLRATKHPIVISNATGCLQIASTEFPTTSWKLNWIHSSLGNAASTISGIETMYRVLKKQGKLQTDTEIKFLAIVGDGGTNDIGLSSLSGAIERGHDFVYLCYDNQSYASSGGQRSSASPIGASTSTTPTGKVLPGKMQYRKDITKIIAAHKLPYVAQTAPWNWEDLYTKAKKAFDIEGPAYLNVLNPCPKEWKIPSNKSIELTRIAADTCVWPLYEIEAGKNININYKPENKLPVTEWLKSQNRFKHLLNVENRWIVNEIQNEVDQNWKWLLKQEKRGINN